MALRVQRSALLLAVIVLSGCETSGFAPVSGQSPSPGSGAIISQTGTSTVRGRIQQLGSDQAALTNAISQQQSQLGSTRAQIGSESSSYSSIVGGITSRLQTGSTPGNPGTGLSALLRLILSKRRLPLSSGTVSMLPSNT